MKKILFFILPVLLLSCSKDDNKKTYPKPEKGDLSVPYFEQPRPEYRKEGNYSYFDFVRFEGEIKGFTKIEHNKFKANETKEYKLEIKLRGFVKISGAYSYYLAIKRTNSPIEYVQSAVLETEDPNRGLTIKMNQGDIISFHLTVKDKGKPSPIQNDFLEINVTEQSTGQ